MISMTGYGTAQRQFESWQIQVTLSSVNRRHAEFRLSVAEELQFLEPLVRERLASVVQRGAVSLQISLRRQTTGAGAVSADLELARTYMREIKKLRTELGLDGTLTLHDVIGLPDVLSARRQALDPEALKPVVLEAFEEALLGLLSTRILEGKTLQADLQARAATLARLAAAIAARAPLLPVVYRERLLERIKELLEDVSMDDERLNKEVVYYADRCDITEELVRLRSHLTQLDSMLAADGPVGRKLDFLLQELGREINTIGSKSADREITANVIDFKADLERVREQVQNLE